MILRPASDNAQFVRPVPAPVINYCTASGTHIDCCGNGTFPWDVMKFGYT